MVANPAEVREEYFYNDPTGVEESSDDGEPDDAEPWNPDAIRVSTKQFSLRHILDQIGDGDLELAPDFQRNMVWRAQQKSRLIESILLQIPLPAFYFAEDRDGMMRVVDGLQRLSTVRDFVRGGPGAFALSGLEYLRDVEKKRFGQLPTALQRRINNAQIVAHVVDPTTPTRVKYDIFKRINTGGTPLNGQEIRHCMSGKRSREFLKRCAQTGEFDRATGGSLRAHVRMQDREMVLRYCAFWLRGVTGYTRVGSMDIFLENATEMLDDARQTPDDRLEELHADFRSAMVNCFEVFGEHAFRKWPRNVEGRSPINRTLFESWSYVIGRYQRGDLSNRRQDIVSAARRLMTDDTDYLNSITASTGDPRKVQLRFDRAEQAAQAGQ